MFLALFDDGVAARPLKKKIPLAAAPTHNGSSARRELCDWCDPLIFFFFKRRLIFVYTEIGPAIAWPLTVNRQGGCWWCHLIHRGWDALMTLNQWVISCRRERRTFNSSFFLLLSSVVISSRVGRLLREPWRRRRHLFWEYNLFFKEFFERATLLKF